MNRVEIVFLKIIVLNISLSTPETIVVPFIVHRHSKITFFFTNLITRNSIFFTLTLTVPPIRNRTGFNVSGTNLTLNTLIVIVFCSVVWTRKLTRSAYLITKTIQVFTVQYFGITIYRQRKIEKPFNGILFSKENISRIGTIASRCCPGCQRPRCRHIVIVSRRYRVMLKRRGRVKNKTLRFPGSVGCYVIRFCIFLNTHSPCFGYKSRKNETAFYVLSST